MAENSLQHIKKQLSKKNIYENLIIGHFNIIKDIESLKYSNDILLNKIKFYEEINNKLIWHIKYLSYSLIIFFILIIIFFFTI